MKEQTRLPLAPSYNTLFDNIDKTVNCGSYIKRTAIVLKAITIAGLPMDDMPCVDVYDVNGVVFSSHIGDLPTGACTWNQEFGDGFFRLDCGILGDFAVLCRFGGEQASNKDKTTLIFKYHNSTGLSPMLYIRLFYTHQIIFSLSGLRRNHRGTGPLCGRESSVRWRHWRGGFPDAPSVRHRYQSSPVGAC